MKILSKLMVMIVSFVLMFGSLQTVEAFPSPIPIIKDYRAIQIGIQKQRSPEEEKFKSMPQPGFDVTLFMNYTVHFAWSKKVTGNFVIMDNSGKKVFEKAISDTNSLDIVPKEIKLEAGQKYSWSVNDNKVYRFTILDKQSEKELLKNLAEIDAEKVSPEERAVEKAIYVQELSRLYSDTLDLYWLSAQWLSEISTSNERLKEEKCNLIEKCTQHHLIERAQWR